MVADDEDNRFCSAECGWTFMCLPQVEQNIRREDCKRIRVPAPWRAPPDPLCQFHQECANADRVSHVMLRKMRKDPKYKALMRQAAEERLAKGIELPRHLNRDAPRTRVGGASSRAASKKAVRFDAGVEAHANALFRFDMQLNQ